MAENVRASLRIGGPLTAEQASVVLEALMEKVETGKISAETLFNAFEPALIAHNVPFERLSDRGSEFDGELRVFNGTESYTYTNNVDYDVVVRVIDVRRAHAGGIMKEFLENYRLIDFVVPPLATSPRERIPIMSAIAEARGRCRR